MKKVSIVLLMGLAIGMTFMSCTKEDVSDACEEVIQFSTPITSVGLTYVVKVDDNGIIRRYQVSEEIWHNLKAEELENGFACLKTLN